MHRGPAGTQRARPNTTPSADDDEGRRRRRAMMGAGLAALAAFGVTWWALTDGAEEAIRKRLARLAEVISFAQPAVNPAVETLRLRNELSELFTADARVTAPEGSATGPLELAKVAGPMRTMVQSLEVGFEDLAITLAPDKKSAAVEGYVRLVGVDSSGPRADRRTISLELVRDGDWKIAAIRVGKRERSP